MRFFMHFGAFYFVFVSTLIVTFICSHTLLHQIFIQLTSCIYPSYIIYLSILHHLFIHLCTSMCTTIDVALICVCLSSTQNSDPVQGT